MLLAYFDDDYSAERNTRLKSYQKIILGQLSSGNWWRSQQDIANRPEPNFHTAASHFYEAAYIIKSVDENRYIKYFSKAIRNQTKAAVRDQRGPKAGWDVSHQLHMTVSDTVSSLITNPDRNVQKTITETEALHRCLGHRAHATAACFHGNPEQIREQVNRTWDVLNDNEVPVYIDHDFLKALKTLATGYECEYDHRFSDAIEHYESIDIPQEQIPVKQRKGLVEIKRAIKSNKYDPAVKTANDVFVDGAPIKTAVEIIAGESPSSPRLKESELDQLIGTTAETLWAFRMFTDFVRQIENPSSPVKTQLESMILEL